MTEPDQHHPPGQRSLRIGNASGFYGDRVSAMREMLEGGPLDVLTGDYLAELTMLILGRDRMRDADKGYAKTFLRQMEECLGLALDKRVRIVANAGGLNPAGLATALRELATKLGIEATVAHVEGDDLRERAAELDLGQPLTANAYLGCWGIVECLNSGADIVVTGRVTDASVIVGPAAAHFGWARDDWNALAGATAAGHVIECGTQATGGNFSFFTELSGVEYLGFPIAEVYEDGSSVITKHDGTGGAVTPETVTAQLLYEITGGRYPGPDVTSRFDTVRLETDGPDRVRISGAIGEPPPPTTKVCLNTLGGFRNEMTVVATGLDLDAKIALVRNQVEAALADRPPTEVVWTAARTEHADAESEQQASVLIKCSAKDPDPDVVGRRFSNAVVELTLASFPGFHPTAMPGSATPYGVYTPGYVDSALVEHTAVLADGTRVEVKPVGESWPLDAVEDPELPEPLPAGETNRTPLGTIVGTRSGDKGGNANVGVWARTDEGWRWLAHFLTVEELRRLLPETADLPVTRHLLPHLRAMNFVVEGMLGEGVSSSTRFDPQGKAIGEWLRSRLVEIPRSLIDSEELQ